MLISDKYTDFRQTPTISVCYGAVLIYINDITSMIFNGLRQLLKNRNRNMWRTLDESTRSARLHTKSNTTLIKPSMIVLCAFASEIIYVAE